MMQNVKILRRTTLYAALEPERRAKLYVKQPVPGSSAGMSMVTMMVQAYVHGRFISGNRYGGNTIVTACEAHKC